MRVSLFAATGLAFLELTVLAPTAWAAADVQCRLGDTVRHLEIRYPKRGAELPCEVIYWKIPNQPESIDVLWRADYTAGFCQEKMDGFIDRLEKDGWSCSPVQEAAPADAPAPEAQQARSEPAPSEPVLSEPPPSEPATPEPAPSETVLSEAVPDAGPPAPAAEPAARRGAREPAVAALGSSADRAAVQEALERDLRRLNELTSGSGGSFAARIGDLGDIDGDGAADAAVLMTFQGTGTAPTGYLVAYLFEDGIYPPVARAYIATGDAAGAADARIEDEAVYVVMPPPPGRAARQHQTAFVLQDGQLLEVDRAPSAPRGGP